MIFQKSVPYFPLLFSYFHNISARVYSAHEVGLNDLSVIPLQDDKTFDIY